ncbi:MAG: DUF1972 domain-containing protein [Bacteroidia bacterium]|nr:DUF1972 domain-containing protein [Bacteroidia bacterium]NNM15020.1 DUF1972 domain-containing protein [Bacteroidia bacterium]
MAIIGGRGYPYVYSGYETFIKELCERLNDKYEFHIYCHAELFEEKPKVVNGIHLHYHYGINIKVLTQLSHSLFATFHAFFAKHDVYFFVNTSNGPFGWFLNLFNRITVINTDGLEWKRPKWKGLGAKYFYWASKLSAKTFKHLIADSEEMRNIYLRKFNRDSTVIAYGANVRKSQNSSALEKFNLKKDSYYLIVGRLIPDNNSDLIIQGFIDSQTVKQLVVVGDIPFKDKYAQKIKSIKHERIILTGYVENQNDLQVLYENCFCYFHGHEYGGTNPTLLKALAYGCCVLALDTAFSREVLNEENYGTYFEKSVKEVEKVIEKVETEDYPVQEYRNKSKERIQSEYTWEKIANQYDTFFNDIMGADA